MATDPLVTQVTWTLLFELHKKLLLEPDHRSDTATWLAPRFNVEREALTLASTCRTLRDHHLAFMCGSFCDTIWSRVPLTHRTPLLYALRAEINVASNSGKPRWLAARVLLHSFWAELQRPLIDVPRSESPPPTPPAVSLSSSVDSDDGSCSSSSSSSSTGAELCRMIRHYRPSSCNAQEQRGPISLPPVQYCVRTREAQLTEQDMAHDERVIVELTTTPHAARLLRIHLMQLRANYWTAYWKPRLDAYCNQFEVIRITTNPLRLERSTICQQGWRKLVRYAYTSSDVSQLNTHGDGSGLSGGAMLPLALHLNPGPLTFLPPLKMHGAYHPGVDYFFYFALFTKATTCKTTLVSTIGRLMDITGVGGDRDPRISSDCDLIVPWLGLVDMNVMAYWLPLAELLKRGPLWSQSAIPDEVGCAFLRYGTIRQRLLFFGWLLGATTCTVSYLLSCLEIETVSESDNDDTLSSSSRKRRAPDTVDLDDAAAAIMRTKRPK